MQKTYVKLCLAYLDKELSDAKGVEFARSRVELNLVKNLAYNTHKQIEIWQSIKKVTSGRQIAHYTRIGNRLY